MKTPSLPPLLPVLVAGAIAADASCPLEVLVDPPGASVSVDSRPPTAAPVSTRVEAGSRTIAVSSRGYADTTLQVACDSASLQRLAVQMRRVATDSVKTRADSLARAKREFARRALAQSSDDLPSALDRLSSNPAVSRDSAAPAPTLAVLPFQASGGAPPEAAVSAGESAILHLSTDRRWRLVERDRFQSVLQEQALWGAGATGSDLELGRALDARYLLMGVVTADGARRLVAMRLVDAQTGRVAAVAATRVDGPAMDQALKDALGEQFGVSGAVFRSVAVPGWGQFWTGRPVRGSLWLAATAGLAGTLAWSILDWADKDSKAEDFKNRDASTFRPGEYDDWIARANDAVSARNDAATRNLVLGSALAGAWALNVADAAWCGWKSSRSARARYFAVAPVVGPDAAGLRLAISLGGIR